MNTGIKVGDVMGRGIITVSPEENVKLACEIMASHDLSGLTVLDKGKVVGILTQGDIVKLVSTGEKAEATKVKEIMEKKIISISPEADISEAAELMVKNDVKRLPVIKRGKLVGILTQNDIVKISPSVYDIIYEKAREDFSPIVESELGLTGECEECGNHSEMLHNVNGTLVCQECMEEIENEI
jgi:CBS domain-containing protein